MGWDTDNLDMAGLADKKLNGMIGEALYLGSIGTLLYLIFLSPGPWWHSPQGPDRACVVPATSSGSDGRTPPAQEAPRKRLRRSGCLSMPASMAGSQG